MIGGGIFGQLGDRFGRKPILLICLYGHILLGVGVYFVESYAGFVAIRFFVGFLIQVSGIMFAILFRWVVLFKWALLFKWACRLKI